MSELLNFPFVSQLNSPTLDGRPNENGEFDCVPASICAGLRYLTRNNSFEPDQLKDAVYGEGWVNQGTAAIAFVNFCAQHGVKLFSLEADSPTQAIQLAHETLAKGHPVIFTQQDDYAPIQFRNLWTHVCIWYKDDPGTLTAMDPFIARALTYSDTTWASRLRSNEIWIMEKIAMATIPQGWHDDGSILTAPNGVPVKLGFREYVLNHNWDANNYPLQPEEERSQMELSNPSLGGGTSQAFRWTVLEWDPKRNVQEMWTGQELLASRDLIATLQQQLSQAQNATLLNDLQTRLNQINTLSKT